MLRFNELAHPDYDSGLRREGVLVLTGRLTGAAPLDVQEYKRRIDRKRAGGRLSKIPLLGGHAAARAEAEEPGFEVWDRERLTELMTASPEAGLTGFADGPLLELLGRADRGALTEARLERFSERWIGGSEGIEWRALLEAALVANRLRRADRLDLACFTALSLLRAVWASAHGVESLPETAVAQANAARTMFINYATELWQRRSGDLLVPSGVLRDDPGLVVHYRVKCLRLVELLGLLGLADTSLGQDVSDWLVEFVKGNPGAAQPVSDRWAVSLLPAVILLARHHRDECGAYLTEVLRWLGDRHEEDQLGLAGPHAGPAEEIEYVMGSSFDHVERPARRSSYLAAIVLDLAALIEDADLYDLAYNEVAAVKVSPFVAVPRDDVSQYMATGHGIDVPVNTSPNYSEYYADGDGWRMASHHDDDRDRYYLGRISRHWDHLALSVVCRDRHWVASLRALLDEVGKESATMP
jgi:hypothetical protein